MPRLHRVVTDGRVSVNDRVGGEVEGDVAADVVGRRFRPRRELVASERGVERQGGEGRQRYSARRCSDQTLARQLGCKLDAAKNKSFFILGPLLPPGGS